MRQTTVKVVLVVGFYYKLLIFRKNCFIYKIPDNLRIINIT